MEKISKYIIGIVLILAVITIAGCNDDGVIRDKFGVYGTAKTSDSDNFDYIELKIGELRDSFKWTNNGLSLRSKGKKPVDNNIIALWDTTKIIDGRKTLEANVFDKKGVSNSEYTYFNVDNLFILLVNEEDEIMYIPSFDIYLNEFEENTCEYSGENGCYNGLLCTFSNNCVVIVGKIDKKKGYTHKIDYANLNLIDWKSDGVILEDSLKKSIVLGEYSDGNKIIPIIEEIDILGYLYYSKLPYNGRYQLRIGVYDKRGNLINKELGPTFRVSGLKDLPTNKIQNPTSNIIKGYLKLWIEKDNSGIWEKYMDLSNDKLERTIITEGDLKLSRLITDPLTGMNNLKINEPGLYKIKMEFNTINNEIIKDEFEFEITNEQFILENQCEDETRRLECSSQRQFLCNNELKLVENCRACGCPEELTCIDNKCV